MTLLPFLRCIQPRPSDHAIRTVYRHETAYGLNAIELLEPVQVRQRRC